MKQQTNRKPVSLRVNNIITKKEELRSYSSEKKNIKKLLQDLTDKNCIRFRKYICNWKQKWQKKWEIYWKCILDNGEILTAKLILQSWWG